MIQFIKRLFKRKQRTRLYPVPAEKKRRIKFTQVEDYIVIALLFMLVAAACSPKAYLPNGCRYNVNAPKFTK